MRKHIALFLFFLCALCAPALADSKPESVVLNENSIQIDLAEGGEYTLYGRVLPEDASQALNWYSSNQGLMTVSGGKITALRTGKGVISTNVPGISAVKAVCEVTIIDSRVPLSIRIDQGDIALEPTQQLQLTATALPETADGAMVWKSSNAGVAEVAQDGLLTCKNEGKSVIRAFSARTSEVYGQITVTVRYMAAPQKINALDAGIEMQFGETRALAFQIEPESASRIVKFRSSDASVATVDALGNVTAAGYGACTVYIASAKNTKIYAAVPVRVNDSRVPERIVAYPSPLSLEPSQARQIDVVLFPQTCETALVWKSEDAAIAGVDENGLVTARREGKTAVIAYCAYTSKVFTRIPVYVKYGENLQKIELAQTEIALKQGDSVPLAYTLTPANGSRALVAESTDESVAYVNAEGRLVAAKFGTAEITLYYHRNKSISATMKVTVEDEKFPQEMTVAGEAPQTVLRPGEAFSARFAFAPETACTDYTYISSNEAIVKIDESGLPVAVGSGVVMLRAQSDYCADVGVDFTVTVQSEDFTLIMPERRTDIAGIEDNLSKIDEVRQSAQRTLTSLFQAGEMPEAEYKKRAQVIDAAFEMYGFAWMVEKQQGYWKTENSEDGAKHFKPGIVYYGMPYTSGNNSNRTYNLARALEGGRYLPVEGQKYYLLNQSNPEFRGAYVGSDCSSFVALALFGYTQYGGSTVKTGTLYYDDRLYAMQDASLLRAGDILVKHSAHVVMFLYWADAAHTQAVFIEQGGNEPAINTVSTSVYDLSYYTENYYRMRRLRSFQ